MSSVMAPFVVEKYPLPQKAAAPVSLFQMRKFALHLVGQAPLHQAHQVAQRQFRRDRHEHMHMVSRQHILNYFHTLLAANLPDNITHP